MSQKHYARGYNDGILEGARAALDALTVYVRSDPALSQTFQDTKGSMPSTPEQVAQWRIDRLTVIMHEQNRS